MRTSPDRMETYRATARRNWAEERRRLALLRWEHGVDRVTLFGSLVRSELFHARSNIDLAGWGLHERHYDAVPGSLRDSLHLEL